MFGDVLNNIAGVNAAKPLKRNFTKELFEYFAGIAPKKSNSESRKWHIFFSLKGQQSRKATLLQVLINNVDIQSLLYTCRHSIQTIKNCHKWGVLRGWICLFLIARKTLCILIIHEQNILFNKESTGTFIIYYSFIICIKRKMIFWIW